MGFFRPSDTPRGRGSIVTVLDVGSTKVCCVVARLSPATPGGALGARCNAIEVLGFGHHRSRGVKSGVITNLDAAEEAIRQAVDAAERMAGVTVESLIVNVAAGRLQSRTCAATIILSERPIEDTDIARVIAAGQAHAAEAGRAAVHSLAIGYSLDGNGGIADPRGMVGQLLGVDMHVATADAPPLSNLELVINRCHLSVEAMVASPYASGLSVLADDEAELGCAVIDFGGGTTTAAVFDRGALVHVDAIAVGGRHITTDIARGLSTPLAAAERLKTMHGAVLPAASDERDLITVPAIGDDQRDVPDQIPRAQLTRIIRPRVEEILELIRDRLNASGYAGVIGRRTVLTGGGSQLTGLAEAARRLLARNVRLGRPLGVARLPEAARGPAFATVAGLLVYPEVADLDQVERGFAAPLAMAGTGGYFARVGRWIKESF